MKLKTTEEGAPVIQDGQPVYIFPDGREQPLDAADLFTKVKGLSEERDTIIQEKKTAEGRLRKFDGIDPDKARHALALQQALGEDATADKLKTEFASMKAEREGLLAQMQELQSVSEEKEAMIRDLLIGNAFRGSEFVRNKMAPAFSNHPERAEALFGRHFKVEDGKVVPYSDNGQKILSRKNPGNVATFEEAMEILASDPTLLRASGAAGGGTSPTAPGGVAPAGKRWSKMTEPEKNAFVRSYGSDAAKQKILEDKD